MAKGQMQKEQSNGARPPDEEKDPSKTADHPGSYNDEDEAKKLSEAVGGIEPIFVPEDIKQGDKSSRLWGNSDVDCPKPEVDTKSGSRPPPKVYRSLSQNTGEDSKIFGTAHSDEGIHALHTSLNSKRYACDPSKLEFGGIRLSATASGDVPEERSGDRPAYTCTDAGGADSAISGSTEDQSYSEKGPFIVKTNDQRKDYRRKHADLRKKAKTSNKQRMIPRTESDCLSDFCFHPEQKHDWSNHGMNKKQIYNYTAPRTGHIFQRERHTNHYMECGTCCHIGDGYVLTCYHCIEESLMKYGWPNEWCLQNDLTVTFPDVSTSRPGRRTLPLQYRFEPNLHAHCKDLDFALLRLDQGNYEQTPPHFTRHTEVNGDQEHPVYIAGYQLHPKHMYGKLVVDASALKFPLQALNLQFVEGWSKQLKETFQVSIDQLYKGLSPWNATYYPITRCGHNFPVLSSLINGASGGFGLTNSTQDDQLPVVNFLFRAGYPAFYYISHFDDSSFHHQYHIRDSFPPCWTFQEGVPIGTIVEEIRKSPDTSLNAIPFLLSNV
ncbi:uncharacterized protein LOC110458035 [Mizuhopecten yessoensis]|uniref:Uncharacterized protein n=1 Tax=Mizuhopecten yessoensis TaxID=6573 RepID=A0A210Q7F9_MIZYE|nr:uncharacterized protein LOC110458035 [Mizuhopecten yessoensis]OWF44655.1 hypothetical protein KP79_PYT20451 [Mizuhopecten yessoensis]